MAEELLALRSTKVGHEGGSGDGCVWSGGREAGSGDGCVFVCVCVVGGRVVVV
jgi:hypothetical protein